MGIMMDFYAGDARRIAEVENDPDGSEIDLGSASFVRAHADFSLHLTPDQIDPLISAACVRRGIPSMALTSSFTEHLAGSPDPMEAENSADVVSPTIVETIASLRADELHAVAEQWFLDIKANLTGDAEEALQNLVRLCKIAQAEKLSVVFAWSL